MNIELEEVVGLDVSDDALELAAGAGDGYPGWGPYPPTAWQYLIC